MHRFYADESGTQDGLVRLGEEDAHHAARVLRMKPGDAAEVFMHGKRFSAEIASMEGAVTLRLLVELPSTEARLRVTLYQGLPKADKLDFIAQKLTELGAARIVPVKMERCVVKLDGRDGEKRRERLQKIAREAAKQCKRARAPEICAPGSWKELKGALAGHDLLLVPWEDASGFGMQAAREQFPQARDIGVVIGPEGGMSAAEVEALVALGAKPLRLGPRILRTETAAVASCALAMLLWGDLG